MPNAIDAFIKGQEDLAAAQRRVDTAQANLQTQQKKEEQGVAGQLRDIAADIGETAVENIGTVVHAAKDMKDKLLDKGGFFGRLADNLAGVREHAGEKISHLGHVVGEKVTAVGIVATEGLHSAGEVASDVGTTVIEAAGAVADGAAAVAEGAAEVAGAIVGAALDD